jgi:ABC-type arginine transport system permease subunit
MMRKEQEGEAVREKLKTSGLSENNNEQTAAATALLLHQSSTLHRFMAPSMTRIATAYFANTHWGHGLNRSKR